MSTVAIKMIKDNSSEVISTTEDNIKVVLEACGQHAEKYAKLKCPVGTPESTGIPGYKGGTLRNSITHATFGKKAYIGTNVEYAPYVEMGTVKMAAQPYLQPAIEDHMDEYQQIIKKYLK